jgi:hypothetical protein
VDYFAKKIKAHKKIICFVSSEYFYIVFYVAKNLKSEKNMFCTMFLLIIWEIQKEKNLLKMIFVVF